MVAAASVVFALLILLRVEAMGARARAFIPACIVSFWLLPLLPSMAGRAFVVVDMEVSMSMALSLGTPRMSSRSDGSKEAMEVCENSLSNPDSDGLSGSGSEMSGRGYILSITGSASCDGVCGGGLM